MIVVLDKEISVDDLKIQQEHFDYYSSVPVVNYAYDMKYSQDLNSSVSSFLG